MRKPAAIGFYPGNAVQLRQMVNEFLNNGEKTSAIAAVLPHAGYAFSGSVAGATLSSLHIEKKRIIIFGPNHTGCGLAVAASTEEWQTPLGIARIDKEFIQAKGIAVDETAHRYEHSIEAQLPFLQTLAEDFVFVPVSLKTISYGELEKLAARIADSESFYIASSDFTHFGPNYGYMPTSGSVAQQLAWVKEKDEEMISMITGLDAKGFYETVRRKGYTVCGAAPIALAVLVAKQLGASSGRMVAYKTSYEVHKSSSFVSYAGIVLA